MTFAPKPENIFESFLETYFSECRRRAPGIEAIAGKWTFEDLIPGLSDFDTRFICSDALTDEDWCRMSTAVGAVHLELCIEHPEWARILEHLPGVNPTWTELTEEKFYYPEYRQWTLYRSINTEELPRAEKLLADRPWDSKDEYFYLKKFFTYYGPYNRGIDPAINLKEFESKYPLHSRAMHYFTPPVQAAVAVLQKRPVKGKFEALREAKKLFPQLTVFDEIFGILDKHYELPALYVDPALADFEKRLHEVLDTIFLALRPAITCVENAEMMAPAEIKKALSAVPVSPVMALFDSCKFCRLFKGRMQFYVNAPAHFDNLWLIQNELGRVGEMFVRGPFRIYWKTIGGEPQARPEDIVDRVAERGIITLEEAEALKRFSALTPGTWEAGREIAIAGEIAEIFDPVFTGLNKVKRNLESRPEV